MEFPLIELPFFTMGLLLGLLLLMGLLSSPDAIFFVVFLPAGLWAVVVAARGRR